jgi:hypothetical protein
VVLTDCARGTGFFGETGTLIRFTLVGFGEVGCGLDFDIELGSGVTRDRGSEEETGGTVFDGHFDMDGDRSNLVIAFSTTVVRPVNACIAFIAFGVIAALLSPLFAAFPRVFNGTERDECGGITGNRDGLLKFTRSPVFCTN